MAAYEYRFLQAFALTLLIELPVFLFLHSKLARRAAPLTTLLVVGACASALTLPYVWFVFPAFLQGLPYVVLSEAFAVAAEAVLYAAWLRLAPARSLALSVACNVASYLVGGFLLARF